MKARARGVRRTSLALEVTDRDHQILMCIGVMRFMSAHQLAREFFPSADYCRRRLRVLYDAGLIAVTLAGSTRPNIVSLTADGVREVAQFDPDLAVTLRLPGTLRAAGLAHHLGVVDCRLYLAALVRIGGPRLLRWINTDGEAIGKTVGQPKLLPDGLADLDMSSTSLRLAIEYDAGTEVLAVLARKCTRYEQACSSGDVNEVWFVVAGHGERPDNIAALAAAAGIGSATRVMPLEHVAARPVRQPLPLVSGRGLAEGQNTVPASYTNTSQHQRLASQQGYGDRTAGRTADRRGA